MQRRHCVEHVGDKAFAKDEIQCYHALLGVNHFIMCMKKNFHCLTESLLFFIIIIIFLTDFIHVYLGTVIFNYKEKKL